MSAITFQKATKAQLKARIALDGPTGAGKTWTALTVAKGLGDRVVLIDSERGSGALYSDQFDYDYFRIDPPYDPARLVEILNAANDAHYDVVVVDSLTHFWNGEGGTLDIVDAAGQRSNGNSYAGWKVGTPALRHLVDTLLGMDSHLLVTMRSKMEYVLQEKVNRSGRTVLEPTKVGMAPEMRAGVEYEFTLVGDMDLEHRMVISKSRCSVLADQVVQPNRAGEMAETFKKWLESGEPLINREQIEQIRSILGGIDAGQESERRNNAKRIWKDAFGDPQTLLAAQFDEGLAFAKELAGVEAGTPEREEGVAEAAGSAGDATEGGDGADGHDVGHPAAEAPSPPDPEVLQMDVERAIKGLPTARQSACRQELERTFGDLSGASDEELRGALGIIQGWPIGPEPIHTEDPANLPGAATGKPLNAKQRDLVAYARTAGVDGAQLVALASLLHETTEPRPLHELNNMAVLEVKRMVDRVASNEIVFETPNGVLIAKEAVVA